VLKKGLDWKKLWFKESIINDHSKGIR